MMMGKLIFQDGETNAPVVSKAALVCPAIGADRQGRAVREKANAANLSKLAKCSLSQGRVSCCYF